MSRQGIKRGTELAAAPGRDSDGGSSSPERILDSVSFERDAILLDIDGTILDLTVTPAGVLVPSSLQRALLSIWKWTGGATALVSGRALADIDRIFAPLELPAIGGHGAEIRATVAGGAVQRPLPLLDAQLREKIFALASHGVLVEDKGHSIAVHYRAAMERAGELQRKVARLAEAHAGGEYEILPGKAVIEIKPTGFNKGTAVLQLMQVAPFRGRRPIFFGDDVTDEAVLAVLPGLNGIGFSVGGLMKGATGSIARPADVRAWLGRLASRAPE